MFRCLFRVKLLVSAGKIFFISIYLYCLLYHYFLFFCRFKQASLCSMNRAEAKRMPIVNGQKIIERFEEQEKMSFTQISDMKCLGKSGKGEQMRSGVCSLLGLVPKPESTSAHVILAWTLLTNDL